MGKSKARRAKIRAANPTGIPSVKELEECQEIVNSTFENDNVESIIEKLQSRGADDKECAAFTIANMASNPSFVASMIENKIIRIAGPLLVDKNLAVRHAIAGCLRNLASCGDHSVCQAMVDQDILTSLVTLLSEYKEPWSPKVSEEKKIDSKSEIFLEACNLLWSLCESSDNAVSVFNEKKLVLVLLPCLNVSVYGLQIPLAVAQCLHTVGEENPDVIEVLSQPLIQEQLKALMAITPGEPEHVLLKTLAAGIMLNIHSGKLSNTLDDITRPFIETVTQTLSEPISQGLVQLAEQISSHKVARSGKCHEEKDLEQEYPAVCKSLKTMDYLLQAKQISLELLTNICFGDDSREEWDDISSSDTNEEVEMEVETPVAPLKLGLEIPCEVHAMIVHGNLFEKVVEQIVIPPSEILNVIMENSEGCNVLKRLSTVRCRALLCLNNMVQGMEIDDIGGSSKVFDLWIHLANFLFKQTDKSNTEQLEAATGSMRAVLQKLAEAKCSSLFSNLSECDLELLVTVCNECEDASTRVNVIRALGTIGCLLGTPEMFQNSYKLIQMIGLILIDTCSKCSDLWVTAEALDVIFDVFAEDHLDPIACEINLVEKLCNLQPFLKGKVKQQRRSLGEHFPIIMTAKTNLIRFIKYKRNQNKS